MSLVNDMLNDLEKRRNNQPAAELRLDWLKSTHESKQPKSSRLRSVLSVALVFLLGGLIFTVYQQYQPLPNFVDSDELRRSSTQQAAIAEQSNPQAGNQLISQSVEPVKINPPGVNLDVVEPSISETVDERAVLVEAETNAQVDDVLEQTERENTSDKIESVSVRIANQGTNDKMLTVPAIKTSVPMTFAELDKQQARQAKRLIRAGQTEQAEARLRDFITTRPAVLSGELLASLYLSQNRITEAKALADELLLVFPQDIAVMTAGARVSVALGEYSQAVSLLQSSQPAIIDHVDYYELLAVAAQKAKQFELSASVYGQLLNFDNSRSSWWMGLGVASDYLQDQSLAVNAYQRALALPDLAPSLRNYASQRLANLSDL